MLGFAAVQIGDKTSEVCGTFKRPVELVQKVQDALFAARDTQQPSIKIDCPVPVQPGIAEGSVEGNPVTVPFGIGQGPIDIKNQRLWSAHN